MRKALMVAALAAALVLGLGSGRAWAQGPGENLDVSYFYDSLAPYGEWIDLNPWGYVFCPYDQGAGWRPYSDGDWIDSDWGWTFESDAPWAWACYHYGRWTYDPECGWVWVPGTVWGPAWVAWRWGDGYCGWAPLPPQVGFGFGIGLELGGFDLNAIPWNSWCFVGADWLGRRGMRRHVYDIDRNSGFLRDTRNVTQYGFEGNRIINRGVDPRELESLTHRTITRYQIGNKSVAGSHISRFSGNTLEMFRPSIKEGRTRAVPKNIIPRHLQVSPQALAQRQAQETQKLNQRYEQSLTEMARRHSYELSHIPRGMTQQQLRDQHQNELRAFETQRQNAFRIMQNRQRREMNMNNTFRGGGGGRHKR
jgi:hypothetical protein